MPACRGTDAGHITARVDSVSIIESVVLMACRFLSGTDVLSMSVRRRHHVNGNKETYFLIFFGNSEMGLISFSTHNETSAVGYPHIIFRFLLGLMDSSKVAVLYESTGIHSAGC